MDAEKKIGCCRFRQMLFGAPLSPFLLEATLIHRPDKQKDDWVTEDLKNSMSMDNVLSGASNIAEED